MKLLRIIKFFFLILAFLIFNFTQDYAQDKKIPPSLKASVSQNLGTETIVTFEFSRPGVKGRKIWGELVPYGLAPGNKYSENKPYPWRAGANQNSTIGSNNDLLINGEKLPAGRYGIHMIPSETEWTIMFSKNDTLWGSYQYNEADDALRIKVTPVAAPHQEWLSFGFEDLAGKAATAYLYWEKLKVPFKVEVVEN